MYQLYREGEIVHKPTRDTVTDELLQTQESSSRYHQRRGTHKKRNRDPLCEIGIFLIYKQETIPAGWPIC
jgi:hypothetical protein